MSSRRDSLPDDATRARFDRAMDELGRTFAHARRQRDELYQREGSTGVARAAWVPGGPSIQELAEGYEVLVQEARGQRREAQA